MQSETARRASAFVRERRDLQSMDRLAVYRKAREYSAALSQFSRDPEIQELLAELRLLELSTLVFEPVVLSRNPRVLVR